ncbi:MAG: ABC transporter permease, partial [Thermomicrobiales bacterium]
MKHVLQNMRYYRRNFIAVSIAIILGVAFVSISVQAGAIIQHTLRNTVSVQYAGADLIVSSFTGSIDDEIVSEVGDFEGVATAEKRIAVFSDAQAGSRSQYTILAPVPDAESIRNELSLDEGRFPESSGEVVLLSQLADHLNIGIGDEVGLTLYSSAVTSNTPVTLDVVGIVAGSNALAESSAPDMYGWPDQIVDWSDEFSRSTLLITTEPDVDPAPLLERIGDSGQGDLVPRTLDQQIDFVVADISNGADILGYGLLAFAIIALFVCGMVIANTFSILVAQRSRNLALLRCVGATSSQIRRSVLTEAVTLGTIASLVSIAGGLVLTNGATRILADRFPDSRIATDVGISLEATLIPFILGFGATMLAALGPANAATRVPPLAALRPTTAIALRSTVDAKRQILTLLLIG